MKTVRYYAQFTSQYCVCELLMNSTDNVRKFTVHFL